MKNSKGAFLLPVFFMVLLAGFSKQLVAQGGGSSNEERIAAIREHEAMVKPVLDLLKDKEVYVESEVWGPDNKRHRFYNRNKNFLVDLVSGGFYFSWTSERGEVGSDKKLVFTNSVTIPFKDIQYVRSYHRVVENPIKPDPSDPKIACIVFQAKNGVMFKSFETTTEVVGSAKQKTRSGYEDYEYFFVPYAAMQKDCSQCTHESLTEKPRRILLEYLKKQGY